jgi:hypothetical protein
METNQILPVLDLAVLQEKANEFAMKGAIEALKEYYSGYNSPYRKAIEEALIDKKFSYPLQLPDIITMLNEKLSDQIDAIANTALSQTYLPQVKEILLREESEMLFSEFLKKFVEFTEVKYYDDCDLRMEKNSQYGWYEIHLSTGEKTYDLTLHEDYATKKEQVKKYHFLSIPSNGSTEKMKISIDGAVAEIPFTRGLMKDNFIAFITRLVLSGTRFKIDTDYFHEDMFPPQCHCD